MSDQYEVCSNIHCRNILHGSGELKSGKCGSCMERDKRKEEEE